MFKGFSIQMILEIIETFKEVVIIGAAIFGSWVAFEGLSTWKKQLKGKDEYELAKRTLNSLLGYKDAIEEVFLIYDLKLSPDIITKDMKESYYSNITNDYKSKLSKAKANKIELQSNISESRIFWGTNIDSLKEDLFGLERAIYYRMQRYFEEAFLEAEIEGTEYHISEYHNKFIKTTNIIEEFLITKLQP